MEGANDPTGNIRAQLKLEIAPSGRSRPLPVLRHGGVPLGPVADGDRSGAALQDAQMAL